MFTFTSRALLASASIALASFSISPAFAQQHVLVQSFDPLTEERGVSIGRDEPSRHTFFGSDVAIRNGLAFIGMSNAFTTGRVAVFTQGAAGWVRTATITASDMTSGDDFGQVVSFRDGLLVVGSRRAAYVFKQVNGVWREQQKIVPPAAEGVASFADLKHEAGVLAIGAQGNETTRDSVYIFEQDATGKFVRRARLTASDVPHLRSALGLSISMTNAIIVVGSAVNAAYILGRNSSGNWVRRQKLVAVEMQPGAGFGLAVAVDRGMILVGAPYAQPPGTDPEEQSGAVYGFLPGTSGSGYVESFQLLPHNHRFGQSIAMFDKRIAVSAWQSASGIPDNGSVITYSRDGSSVLELGFAATFPNTSISIANNLLLVGSPYAYECYTVTLDCDGHAELFHLNRFEP